MTKPGRNGSTPLDTCCSHKSLIHEVRREFSAQVLTRLRLVLTAPAGPICWFQAGSRGLSVEIGVIPTVRIVLLCRLDQQPADAFYVEDPGSTLSSSHISYTLVSASRHRDGMSRCSSGARTAGNTMERRTRVCSDGAGTARRSYIDRMCA